MPGRAAGFLPNASAADAVAFAWPKAHKPEAMAMEKPAVTATQLVAADSPPWANAGAAKHSRESAMKRFLSLRIVLSPRMNCRQWVVDVIPLGDALTLIGELRSS